MFAAGVVICLVILQMLPMESKKLFKDNIVNNQHPSIVQQLDIDDTEDDSHHPPDAICMPGFLESELRRVGPPKLPQHPNVTKAAVAALVSGMDHAHVTELLYSFPSLDSMFLNPFQMDFLLFYDVHGIDFTHWAIVLAKLGWKKDKSYASAAMSTMDGRWLTNLSTHVYIRGRELELPRYLQANMSLLQDPGWLKCVDRRWSLQYVLYSGAAFTHHLMLDPLVKNYDWVFKIDTDIRILSQPEVNPLSILRGDCVFAHTGMRIDYKPFASCQATAWEALLRFGQESKHQPAGKETKWCQRVDYFYGNFLAYSTQFHTSDANALMNRWLYECWPGYFRNRWGDQASWVLYLCQWLNIPDPLNSTHICEVSGRNKWFRHG